MDFSKRRPQPHKHLLAFAAVLLLHVAVVYALISGLGSKVIEVIRAPVRVSIVESPPEAPPEPPAMVLPPPDLAPPPRPVFIPPPEVVIAAPPPESSTITAPPLSTSPAEPLGAARASAPAASAAPAPAARVSAAVACSNYARAMGDAGFPRDALRLGLEQGEALIEFTLAPDGEVKDVKALSASHPAFARASRRIVERYKCQGQGQEVKVTVPFSYRQK